MRQQEFFEKEPVPAQQYRMRRLQVFNWGTFSNLHDIPVAEEGFLFIGRSGSGKSTLLDALSALLAPPQWLVFNAAAREGEKGRHDRSWVSYIRGAWADQTDDASGEIAAQYLRPGTTWSALAVEFAESNAPGGIVTLLFSGGGALRLEVECLEAEAVDLGPVWTTVRCPHHTDSEKHERNFRPQ